MERILHVALKGVDGEEQAALCAGLRTFGVYKEIDSRFQKIDWCYQEIDWRKENLPKNRGLFLHAVETYKPTIVFMQLQTANVILPEQITEARRINPDCLYLQWNGDLRERAIHPSMSWQFLLGAVCDSTLLTNYDDVAALNDLGIRSDYFQIGYDWNIYKPRDGMPTFTDEVPSVVFLGSYYPQLGYESQLRLDLATELYEALEGDFACYGHQWGGYPWGMPRVSDATEAFIYQNCKIAVALSLRSDIKCYTSDRLFRATGCGAFTLVKRFSGMEKLFYIDHQSCVAWDTVPELVELVKHYLTPEQAGWRRIIGENGVDVARLHSWHYRMADLRRIVDTLRMGVK